MRKERMPYVGVLFAGILIDEKRGPQVLEFNARFGDPETQGNLHKLMIDPSQS